MTDKGSRKPVNNLEDVTELNELDDLDVPTTNVYTRTGKAAPTEVLPSTPKPVDSQPGRDSDLLSSDTGVTASGARSVDTTPSRPVEIEVERDDEPAAPTMSTATGTTDAPVAASTVSTAGALHTTEAADELYTDTAVRDDIADAPQPPIGRGTIDVGLFLLRLVLGAVLIVTSLAILFQLGGNAGLAGLEDDLAGYNYPRALAIALPTMGLAAGVFLVLGLLTPIAAMVAVAATGFGAIHTVDTAENAANLFAWEPSIWLAISLFGMALAVQFTGPGVFGIDFSRSWTRRPMVSSWICAAIGIAGAILMWWFL